MHTMLFLQNKSICMLVAWNLYRYELCSCQCCTWSVGIGLHRGTIFSKNLNRGIIAYIGEILILCVPTGAHNEKEHPLYMITPTAETSYRYRTGRVPSLSKLLRDCTCSSPSWDHLNITTDSTGMRLVWIRRSSNGYGARLLRIFSSYTASGKSVLQCD